jgi:anti-anti-sigma factor
MEGQPMQTSTPSVPLREGQIFSREISGNTLILNPLIHLGSLNEPEIALETQELLDFLNHSASANLVIDLAQGDYLGTSMLGAMVKLWKRVSQRGGRLALCNVSESITQVLRVTKLQTVWPIYGSREQALAAVGG